MASRRAILVRVALGLMLGGALAVAATAHVALRTLRGRAWVQGQIEQRIATALAPGSSVALHGLRLVPLGTIALDSLAVHDAAGLRLAGTGALFARIGLAELFQNVLLLDEVRIEDPALALVQDSTGGWNYESLLAATSDTAPAPTTPWRIRLRTLSLGVGRVSIVTPDSLPSLPPVRTEITDVALTLGESSFDTESSRGTLTVAALSLAANDPPVRVREAEGTLALFADSVQVDLPRIALTNSRVGVRGSIAYGARDRDPRIGLTVRAPEVDLADVAWINELLPRAGAARAVVRVTNGRARGVLRYAFTDLEVRATDTELRGRLLLEVGEGDDDVWVRDLDVTAAPLDLRLVREIFGDASPPPPWDGRLFGRLRARGGALTDWRIDPSTLEFEDRRVGAARSRFTVEGNVDLLADETVFKPLHVRIDSMDVRTAGGITDVADSLRGYLVGRVTLTGPLDNFRFEDLDLVHVDGALPRSHVRGDGRVAEDESTTWLEARLALDTVGLAALGRAFTAEPLAGRLHGSVNVSAIGDSTTLALSLSGEGADIVFNGATSMDTSRLVLQGELGVWALDLSRLMPKSGLLEHRLTARATLGIDGPWEDPAGPITLHIDSSSSVGRVAIRRGLAALAIEPGGLRVDTLALSSPLAEMRARGRLSRDPALRDSLRFTLRVDSLASFVGLLPDSLVPMWRDSLSGRVTISGVALGSLDTVDVRATLVADSVAAGSYGVARVDAELLLDGVPRATRGLVTFDAAAVSGAGLPIHRISAEALIRNGETADASLRMIAADTIIASARAEISLSADTLRARLDSLEARLPGATWTLQRPAWLRNSPDRLTVDSLEMRSADGARLALDLAVDTSGTVTGFFQALRVPLSHARFTGMMSERVAGALTLDARVDGTLDDPRMAVSMQLDSARVDGQVAPELRVLGTYASRSFGLTMGARAMGRDALTATAELPIDLALRGRKASDRLVEAPVYIRLNADGAPLAGFQALTPGLRNVTGGFDADVQVTGTWDALVPRGIVLLRDGAFDVPALGTGFRDLEMDVGLAPDSIFVYRARLADDRSAADTATVEGVIARTPRGWTTDIRTIARQLRVIDDPRVAEADVSWNLRLRGLLDSLQLGGDVVVPTANIVIGGERRRILELEEDLVVDTTTSRFAPQIERLTLRLGNEVRLRSPEANVQLTGEVQVVGTLTNPEVRGEIFATRGTYRLDLGLLQRTFQVDSGLVRMNGPLSIPPTLDIHTSYTVRQAQREDVHINARLSGSVEQPRLALGSSDLGTTASDTEIISYLLFGAPTFVLDGQRGSAVRLATAALVPSLGGAAERALGAKLPFLSELQVVTVAGDSPSDFTLNSFEGLLNSFALTAGTQIGTDTYLRLSGGVCRGANRAAQSLPAWFGITGEYRPRERLSAEVSMTPGSAPCNRIGTFTQIYQFGVDLYRDWRW